MLNLSPPHLRRMNVSHVSGTEGVSFVEARSYFKMCECVLMILIINLQFMHNSHRSMQCMQDTDT